MYQFMEGEYVIITEGEYYACSGLVTKVVNCSCGLKDYEVQLIAKPELMVLCHGNNLLPAITEDGGVTCRPAEEADKVVVGLSSDQTIAATMANTVTNLFTSILTPEERKRIATEIFTEKIKSDIDTALKNRAEANMSFVDQVVRLTCNDYVDKLAPEYEGMFLDEIKKILTGEFQPGEDDQSFMMWLQYRLESVTEKWIHDNKSQVIDFMMDNIKEVASNISKDKLNKAITKNVSDVLDTFTSTVTKGLPHNELKEENKWMFEVLITSHVQHIRKGPGTNYDSFNDKYFEKGDVVKIKEVRNGEEGADMWGMVSFVKTVKVGNETLDKLNTGWIAIHSKYNQIYSVSY